MPYGVAGPLRRLLPALLLLPLLGATAHAQRTFRTIGRDVGAGVSDMLYVWGAPARGDRRDWAGAGLAAAAVLAAGAADRSVNRWVVAHPSSAAIDALRPFREGEDVPLVDLGSPRRIHPLAGALYLAGFVADSRDLRDAGMGCATALQAQATVHALVLEAVQRERPLTAAGDPYDVGWGGGPWERHAFYSGHAANVMSCVSYWNGRVRLGAAEPVLYALALGIGLARMPDQRHWASDIVTGSVLGYAVGTTAGRRGRRRAERDRGARGAERGAGLVDGAYLTGGAGGATLGWRLAF
jgi:membrane-associated phospholipid phosphatase